MITGATIWIDQEEMESWLRRCGWVPAPYPNEHMLVKDGVNETPHSAFAKELLAYVRATS